MYISINHKNETAPRRTQSINYETHGVDWLGLLLLGAEYQITRAGGGSRDALNLFLKLCIETNEINFHKPAYNVIPKEAPCAITAKPRVCAAVYFICTCAPAERERGA